MTTSSIFSTYRGGENRVTSSMLAVFQRVGLDITERILANAIGEAALELVTFASQPSAGSAGVPDAELKASFRYLIETKVVPNTYSSNRTNAQLVRHLVRLDGSHADEKLLVITPDAEEPPGIRTMGDGRVVWTSFALIAQAIDEVLNDPSEPASEQQRFLLRELVTFLDAEGLVGIDDKQIKPEIPRVLQYYREVDVTEEQVALYETSGDPLGPRIAEVIRWRLADGSQEPFNDVYLLSRQEDAETVMLASPVRHEGRGAWVQGQRYTSMDRLRSASRTSDLG